jgi:uncharacterized membrane protein
VKQLKDNNNSPFAIDPDEKEEEVNSALAAVKKQIRESKQKAKEFQKKKQMEKAEAVAAEKYLSPFSFLLLLFCLLCRSLLTIPVFFVSSFLLLCSF